ncbi:aromatase/cyclase [Sorangium sp. So ce185]|uniref:aromatase/cyclase n=1 Tax=Sorangium sp. So ce185 TaxID=3133287 RepID=UPI003F634AE5
MKTITNEIVIDASPSAVYSACVDIERWPRIFPTVLSTSREEVGEDEIVMTMSVANDFGTNTVRSRRRYTPSRERIDFEMLTLPPQIGSMTGTWVVEPSGHGSRLLITHTFDVPPQLEGDAREEALSRVGATIFGTTEHVLSCLAASLERR